MLKEILFCKQIKNHNNLLFNDLGFNDPSYEYTVNRIANQSKKSDKNIVRNIIAFSGLYNSGKTTLCNEVFRIFNEKKSKYKSILFIENKANIEYILKHNSRDIAQDKLNRLFFDYYFHFIKHAQQDYTLTFGDQFIYNNLAFNKSLNIKKSLYFFRHNLRRLDNFSHSSYSNTKLISVHIKTDIDNVLNRNDESEKAHFSVDDVIHLYERILFLEYNIYGFFIEYYRFEICNNDEDISHAIRKIVTLLNYFAI